MESIVEIAVRFWADFQQGILPDLGTWNYMLVAFFMLFQGRISAVLGGIAVAAGYLNLLPIILVALLARLFVDLFWYNVGSTGQINRVGQRFSAYQKVADRVESGIQRRPVQFILLAKLSNGLSLPAVIAAGNAKVPYKKWLPASFTGEVLWTLPLLLLGYFATDALSQLEGGLTYITFGTTAIFVLVFLFPMFRAKLKPSQISD